MMSEYSSTSGLFGPLTVAALRQTNVDGSHEHCDTMKEASSNSNAEAAEIRTTNETEIVAKSSQTNQMDFVVL
jgi:hypothetical protein